MSYSQKIDKKDNIIPYNINASVLFYVVIILLAAFKQLYGVRHHLDIPFFDETEYLQKGIGLATHAYNNWGPSYNLWYYLLSLICPDSVNVFYLNYCLLMIIIPVLLFLLLISFSLNKNIALIATLSFLTQPLLVSNFTFVSHFCLTIILLAFLFINLVINKETKVLIAITASWICMYARQEFLLVVATLLIIWVILIAKQKKVGFNPMYAIFILCTTGLYSIFGFISFRAQGIDRSLFAFKQHFYTNYIFWTKRPLTLDQYDALDIFHGSKTMLQCLLSNPTMFLKHVGTNMLNYVINLYKYMENWLLPPQIFHYLGKGKHILFLIFIATLLWLILKKKTYRNIIESLGKNKFTSLIIASYFIWSFFSIFMIFPERHYIILQFVWWVLLLLILLKNHISWLEKSMPFYVIVILLLLLTPTSKSVGYYHNMLSDSNKQPNLKTIEYLKKNNTSANSVLFTSERGFNAYLPDNYKELFLEQDDVRPYINNGSVDILAFFKDKKVNIIFMNEKMQKLFVQTLGNTGMLLLNEPEKVGFRKQLIAKNLKAYLLIKI